MSPREPAGPPGAGPVAGRPRPLSPARRPAVTADDVAPAPPQGAQPRVRAAVGPSASPRPLSSSPARRAGAQKPVAPVQDEAASGTVDLPPANVIGLLLGSLSRIDQGLLVLDARSRIAFANPAFRALFGLPEHLVRPGNLTLPMHRFLARRGEYGPDDPEAYVRIRQRAIHARAPCRLDRQRPDGRFLEIIGSPIDGGGYVFTFSDVTERRRLLAEMEALVAERTEALEKANAELVRLATLDPLLGILNRRAAMDEARHLIAGAEAAGAVLCVLMIDLDRFKLINDTYGHTSGDLVLIETSRAMRHALGSRGLLARYGGEEFLGLIVLPSVDDGVAVAERVRAAVAAASVQLDGGPVRITASVGVSVLRAGKDTLDAAIDRADDAVYLAKAAGRDCVRVGGAQ